MPVCQSWQWMTSGWNPMVGRMDSAALEKKQNFSMSQWMSPYGLGPPK